MNVTEFQNTGLKEAVIERIRGILTQYPEVEEAILYGSRAKGNYRPYSDIDLSLKGSTLNLRILYKIENELDDLLLPYTIDLSIFHMISNEELVGHINRVGVKIYGSGELGVKS